MLVHTTITSNLFTTMSAFAIYIPCIYKNITEEMVAQTFYRKKIGSVRHVELVHHNDKYNRAHVFFESMYPFGEGAEKMRQVDAGETVKLQYSRNQHVFWLLVKNRREYDGVSKKGWYDVEAENAKKEAAALQETDLSTTPVCVEHVDDISDINPEDPDAFGLVSVDYVRSLEIELARMRARCDNIQYNLPHMTPIEEYLAELRNDNCNMRMKYAEMQRIKLPVNQHMVPPILENISNYQGFSPEFEAVLCREVERFRKDNETLGQNINVLSCLPNTSIDDSQSIDTSYATDDEIVDSLANGLDQLHLPPSPITIPRPALTRTNTGLGAGYISRYQLENNIPDCDGVIHK